MIRRTGGARWRWLVVLATAAVLIAVPLLVVHRPAPSSDVTADELAARIAGSADVGWSGRVASSGGLQLPDTASFANLAGLLGSDHDLRVWWADAEHWRVDDLRPTGETNLFRTPNTTIRWDFESRRATLTPVSSVRLPDAPDLLPATLARSLLDGAAPATLERLPTRRVAGVVAAGLRLTPADAVSTLRRVDVWAEPATGLPLRVDAYGDRARADLTTTVTELSLTEPTDSDLQFVPGPGVDLAWEEAVDVVAAANAFSAYDLPASVVGLASRDGKDPGSVGVYGRGVATMIVVPLRGQVAGPLRQRLRTSPDADDTSDGVAVEVGAVGLLLTPRREGGSLLLAGTVTAPTLRRAAAALGATR